MNGGQRKGAKDISETAAELVTDCTKARKGKGRKTVASGEPEQEQSGLSDTALEAEKGWGPH